MTRPSRAARSRWGPKCITRERMREAPPSGLPAISPSRGEIGGSCEGGHLPTLAIGENGNNSRSPPLRG
ncbi:hypothetical protein EOA38_29090, partial [Mesorhizobium sp. M1E.F.Ca.ET.041.01.1.1]